MKIEFSKQPDVSFDADEHLYTLRGRPLHGVTTILQARQKPWLGPWMLKSGMEAVREAWKPGTSYTASDIGKILDAAKKSHKSTAQKGKDTGHLVHSWIEEQVRHEMAGGVGFLPIIDPLLAAPIGAWCEWRKQHEVEWFACEQIVVNESEWYAGTLDSVARVDGKIGLGDWKSSKTWSEDWGLQTALYKAALEDMGAHIGDSPASEWGRWMIRLDKEGAGFNYREIPTDYLADKMGALACLAMNRWNGYAKDIYEAKR